MQNHGPRMHSDKTCADNTTKNPKYITTFLSELPKSAEIIEIFLF